MFYLVRLCEAEQNNAARALGLALRVLSGELPPPPSHRPGVQTVVQQQRRLTQVEAELLAAEYRGGKTTYELASDWKINRSTVTMALKRAEVPIRRPRLSREQLLEAVALREEGWSFNRLGAKFGIDPKTIKARVSGTQ